MDSRILSLLKSSDDPDVVRAPRGWRWMVMGAVNKTLDYLHLPLTDKLKIKRIAKNIGAPMTMPITSFKTLHRHPLVQQADIIHLHGVAGFVDYPSFFSNIAKPIVWTQHDEILFSGLSHFDRTKELGGKLEEKYYHIKLRAVHSAKQLGIVFLSDMMYEKFHVHEMVNGRPMTIINNPVDTDDFQPIDRKEARRRLGIADEAIVFTFVAANITDRWKGFATLCEAFQELQIPHLVLLAVGNNPTDKHWPDFVKLTGSMQGGKELSIAYSAANYFISPSLQEAFSQTPIESMACGVPAILTPVSGTSELITAENGVRCKGFSTTDLIEGIRTAMNRRYDAPTIRKEMQTRFSTEEIAKKYLTFYKEMLNTQDNNKKCS